MKRKQSTGTIAHSLASSSAIAFGVLLAGCASIDPPPSIINADVVKDLNGEFNLALTAFKTTLNKAQKTPDDDKAASDFLEAGLAIVDLSCKNYFQNLGLAAQQFSYGRKQLNLAGGVVAAIQGLTGVAVKAVAITASAFGFGGASADAYADSYLFSPDVGGVQTLIEGAQAAYKQKLSTLGKLNYAAAIDTLKDYETICQVQTIRRLINESVAAGKPISSFDAATDPKAGIAKAVGEQALTDDEVVYLYWLVYKNPDSADLKLITNGLASVGSLFDAQKKLSVSNTQRTSIRTALAPLVQQEEATLDARIDALRTAATQGTVAAARRLLPGPGTTTGFSTHISIRVQ